MYHHVKIEKRVLDNEETKGGEIPAPGAKLAGTVEVITDYDIEIMTHSHIAQLQKPSRQKPKKTNST